MPASTTNYKLRPYQDEAVKSIMREFNNVQSTLVVAPTGCGKTQIFCQVIDDLSKRGRVMVLAHREELISQAVHRIADVTGCMPDIEKAELYASEGTLLDRSQIVVSSIQTQISQMGQKSRMSRFKPDDFSLLVIDEAHHAPSQSYRRAIDYYSRNKGLKVLGVTATPDRADEKAMGRVFESVAFEYEMLDAISQGWLVPVRQEFVIIDGLDFSAIRTTAGDLNGADLAHVMEYEKVLHGYVDATLSSIGDKKTLVFATSVAQAERMCEIFNRYKPNCAKCVFGHTPKPERYMTVTGFRNNAYQILVNVGVATEGFDLPGEALSCIVMARPTKSRSLYAQMLGRGMRPVPGIVDSALVTSDEGRRQAIEKSAKPYIHVLDFAGNSGRHKLIYAADILGGRYDDAVVDRALRRAKKSKGARSVEDELKIAEEEELEAKKKQLEAEARRSASKRKFVRGNAKWTTKQIDPFTALDIMPWREKAWDKKQEPTDKQKNFLERAGVTSSDALSKRHCSQLIDEIIKRRQNHRPTFKQARLLSRYGINDAGMSMKDASNAITAIANNGWKATDELRKKIYRDMHSRAGEKQKAAQGEKPNRLTFGGARAARRMES